MALSQSPLSSFSGLLDNYNGVTVDSTKEPCSAADFTGKLRESLKRWIESNKRTIWFRVDLQHSAWVPILAENGFKYHHAKEDAVMMYRWLPENSTCNIPPYAHTLLGVGAVVVNSKNQVLVVKERHFQRPHWKLPGGYVEPGEDLVQAAIREVKEETNVSTSFLSVISFRHTHNRNFNCSDLYFVVCLKPQTDELKKCDQEIEDLVWMDITEYLSSPSIHNLNKLFVEKYVEYKSKNLLIECKEEIHQVLKTRYNVFAIGDGKL